MSLFFKTRQLDGKTQVFDPVRKRFIILTPEEEVRQQILAYMVEHKNYPINYIAIEKKLVIAGKDRRFDIVIYNDQHQPSLLVECKRPEVALSQTTMEQAALYNLAIKAPYLVISNGRQHFVVSINFTDHSFNWLKDLPERNVLWPDRVTGC